MWRMATTLAMLVIAIIASSSMKLPKVSWPIESENDRISSDECSEGIGIGTGLREPQLYDGNACHGELAACAAALDGHTLAHGWRQTPPAERSIRPGYRRP